WPLEAWFYPGSERVPFEFFVIFYRKWGGGPFRIWDPGEGIDVLFANGVGEHRGNAPAAPSNIPEARGGSEAGRPQMRPEEGTQGYGAQHSLTEIADFQNGCGSDDHARKIMVAVGWVQGQGMAWQLLEARFAAKPEGPGGEWINGFGSYSTAVAPGTEPLPAQL